jgi:polyhydroxyalkanoate synthesis regulator phasin
MPKLDRHTLSQFLPNPRAIAAYEEMTRAVDETLPEATAEAQTTADQAQLMATMARSNADMLRQLLNELTARVLADRDSRSQIAALQRRIADLESQVMALRRGSDIDQMRRQIADLQSQQLKR